MAEKGAGPTVDDNEQGRKLAVEPLVVQLILPAFAGRFSQQQVNAHSASISLGHKQTDNHSGN